MTEALPPIDDVTAPRPLPLILVAGIDADDMLSAGLSLQLGLPDAVAVCHTIDAEREVLTRVVSDLTGVIEREQIELGHVCVACAIREDLIPTLERLAAQRRWAGIIAQLPVTAQPSMACRMLRADARASRRVRVAAVVTALEGSTVTADLLGDELLDERGLATSAEDRRGVAEVASAMVEYADAICLSTGPDAEEGSLVATLARPRVPVVTDPTLLDGPLLARGVHRHVATEDWVDQVRRGGLPPVAGEGTWRLDLRSDRPFHPERFQDELAVLGAGPRRSRGCFWLPTRPDAVCVWDGAGGQASVGPAGSWDGQQPITRITVVGLVAEDLDRSQIEAAFEHCLLTDAELAARGTHWDDGWDGLEPWLGPIERVA